VSGIEFYYWPTPNCFKVSILLEELEIPYQLIPVDITSGDQFSDGFTQISPNQRIPAIVDVTDDGARIPIFESGAILLYLAEKTGRFLPVDASRRLVCMQWLFWQVGGLGPMAGQAHHFRLYAREEITYAIKRYSTETRRLYGVLDRHLAGRQYICDAVLSIADFAVLPWIFRHERQGIGIDEFPEIERWYETLLSRTGVTNGLHLAAGLRNEDAFQNDSTQQILFRNDT